LPRLSPRPLLPAGVRDSAACREIAVALRGGRAAEGPRAWRADEAGIAGPLVCMLITNYLNLLDQARGAPAVAHAP